VRLIDTSSWIDAMRRDGDPAVRARVLALMQSGEAAWCDMVRLELWNGLRGAAERRRAAPGGGREPPADRARGPCDEGAHQVALGAASSAQVASVQRPVSRRRFRANHA